MISVCLCDPQPIVQQGLKAILESSEDLHFAASGATLEEATAQLDRLRPAVLIVDRGRPVARLEPVGTIHGEQDRRLTRLVRAGMVRPGRGAPPRSLFPSCPPCPKMGSFAVATLTKERREGR